MTSEARSSSVTRAVWRASSIQTRSWDRLVRAMSRGFSSQFWSPAERRASLTACSALRLERVHGVSCPHESPQLHELTSDSKSESCRWTPFQRTDRDLNTGPARHLRRLVEGARWSGVAGRGHQLALRAHRSVYSSLRHQGPTRPSAGARDDEPLIRILGFSDAESVSSHFQAAGSGQLPTKPAGHLTITSRHDPLQSSPGPYGPLNTLRYETVAPYEHPGGDWARLRVQYRHACLELINELVPEAERFSPVVRFCRRSARS